MGLPQSCPGVSIRNSPAPFRESIFVALPILRPLRLCVSARESSVPRSRTSVLNLPIRPRHRFFSRTGAHSAHDRALPSPNPPPPRVLVVCFFGRASARVRFHPSRGHTRRNPLRSRRRLLLQMRPIQNEIRLHENVRNSEVCFPLVGHFLRKTSRVFPIAKQGRRPPTPPSRPRRTRQQLVLLNLNCDRFRRDGLFGCRSFVWTSKLLL